MADAQGLHVKIDARVGALRLRAEFSLTSQWSVIFGPSGSGKSSLLRLIAGLWTPVDSAILLNGEALTKLPPHQRRIAMVSQQPALFPHLNVQQNIAFGHTAMDGRADWLTELTEAFGLTTLTHARPVTLSGGERQRVAIARALASTPKYLLLDEVFTGMHQQLQDELIARLRNYSERLHMPILSVTHDVAEALASADETVKMEAGQIAAQGPTAAVLQAERDALIRQLGV